LEETIKFNPIRYFVSYILSKQPYTAHFRLYERYAPTLKIGPHLVILTESARAVGRALIISGICDAVQPEHNHFNL
jgi:hypothetical protein